MPPRIIHVVSAASPRHASVWQRAEDGVWGRVLAGAAAAFGREFAPAPPQTRSPSRRLGDALVADDGRCVTAGWAFFQAVAFERPDGNVAVVVVNEAAAPAAFELVVDGDLVLASIGPHTVQTYVVSEGGR